MIIFLWNLVYILISHKTKLSVKHLEVISCKFENAEKNKQYKQFFVDNLAVFSACIKNIYFFFDICGNGRPRI